MINIEVAPYGFRLHFTTVKSQLAKVYKELTDKELDTDAAGLAWHHGYDFYIGVFDEGPACLDTLAHEITHTCIDMAAFIGYNPGTEQEPFCFLTGWMTKTLLFAHPKFKEAMNESVGTGTGNGRRRAPKGDGSHIQQRGSGEGAQQSVRSSCLPALCTTTCGLDPDVPS